MKFMLDVIFSLDNTSKILKKLINNKVTKDLVDKKGIKTDIPVETVEFIVTNNDVSIVLNHSEELKTQEKFIDKNNVENFLQIRKEMFKILTSFLYDEETENTKEDSTES